MAVDEGFIPQSARSIIISAPSVKELIGKLEVMIAGVEERACWVGWLVDVLGTSDEGQIGSFDMLLGR